VPEVTLYFWIVKVLCTTVGATASAFLASNVGLGLTQTTYITVALSLATVIVQFTRLSRSREAFYWFTMLFTFALGRRPATWPRSAPPDPQARLRVPVQVPVRPEDRPWQYPCEGRYVLKFEERKPSCPRIA
jgi:repeat uncharacterized protein DUF347